MKILMRVRWVAAIAALLVGCWGSEEGGSSTNSSVGGGGVAGGSVGGGSVGGGSVGGGSVGGGATVGSVIDQPTLIDVAVNLTDGFMEPVTFDRWSLDVVARTLVLNDGAPISLDAAQCDGLVTAVTSAEYRTQPECVVMGVDGAPYPPLLILTAGEVSHNFLVSDAECSKSDHSAFGDVISCGDFGAIHALLQAVAPSEHAFTCQDYW